MFGGGKFSESDIVRGKRTLANVPLLVMLTTMVLKNGELLVELHEIT